MFPDLDKIEKIKFFFLKNYSLERKVITGESITNIYKGVVTKNEVTYTKTLFLCIFRFSLFYCAGKISMNYRIVLKSVTKY